jgi:hypothetical protein
MRRTTIGFYQAIDMMVLPAVFITLATLFVMAIMGQQ